MTLTETLRPFLWLAAIAFMVGFLSYLVIGPSTPAVAQEQVAPARTALSGPISDDEWNIPKRI